MKYRAKDWGWVIVEEDDVQIRDDEGTEVVKWIEQEWIEDPAVVGSIVNAVSIALTKGAKEVKRMIK
jgi:hypothetical protein